MPLEIHAGDVSDTTIEVPDGEVRFKAHLDVAIGSTLTLHPGLTLFFEQGATFAPGTEIRVRP